MNVLFSIILIRTILTLLTISSQDCILKSMCRYGNLRDEMLRENRCWHKRQVFVREAAIRLGITLERAVTQVRNAELVKLQQKELKESHHPKIVERSVTTS